MLFRLFPTVVPLQKGPGDDISARADPSACGNIWQNAVST